MFARAIENLLEKECVKTYALFRNIRKEFPDLIPTTLPLVSIPSNWSFTNRSFYIYKNIYFNTTQVKRKIKIDKETFSPTIARLRKKPATVTEIQYLRSHNDTQLIAFLIKYLKLRKNKLKDHQVRDSAYRIMHNMLKDCGKLIFCETPKDHVSLYEVHAISCMSPRSSSYNTWLRKYIYTHRKLWPSMWYSYCPYTQGVYMKVGNRGVARTILVRKNPTHKFKDYSTIYAESTLYKKLFEKLLIKKGFKSAGHNCYIPNIQTLFKVPAIRVLNKLICPLPYYDCLNSSFYCYFDKEISMFCFGPRELLPKTSVWLHNPYHYRGYLDTNIQPAHDNMKRRA